MGGIGSGAQRSTNIGNVEDIPALDIRLLRRLGLVMPGECMIDTVHWRIDGLSTSCARLRVDLSDIARGGVMTISGVMQNGTITQDIAVCAVPAPMGGHRCYYICPATGDRAEILYYAGGRFASRKAQRLSYIVQSMNILSAARLKARKLRRRLKGNEGLPRPRGRNRYDMVRRAEEAELMAKILYHDHLCSLADQSGTRGLPNAKGR